ncbi:MAG: DUF1273 domain-containing protein [Provencibacterium sp.]|jgi:uncharacterized phage-like protein YoqJ|nr:DUF1273 domain-containing protein [Provencibacterium sp.]
MQNLDRLMSACFSGYRAQKFPFPFWEGNREYDALALQLEEAVRAAINAGYAFFYCGAAQGFDLLAAETVLRLREMGEDVRLRCAIPFPGQAEGWPKSWRQRYEQVLCQSDELLTLSSCYSRGCYQLRNRYMVDHSCRLICYFDGRLGGTAATVRYAMKKKLEIVNLAAVICEGNA